MERRTFLKLTAGLSAAALAASLGLSTALPAQAATILLHHRDPGLFGVGVRGFKPGTASLNTIASTLNMSVAELQTELRSGKSVADIAQAKGVSLDAVIEALISAYRQQLDAAVSAGRLTQAQADTLLANYRAILPGHLQVRAVQGLPKGRAGMPRAGEASLVTVADKLGLTVAELVAQLREGKSVADLAKEKGVALETVSSALADQYKQLLDAQVAAGRITQAQAERALALYKENLPALLSLKGGFWGGFGRGKGRGMRAPSPALNAPAT
ncbi:MAG: hypothetical protein RMM31_01250 [Anaerolineae bacterium]|nr:hypothetical protein [Anaerolineae bacterium]